LVENTVRTSNIQLKEFGYSKPNLFDTIRYIYVRSKADGRASLV